MKKGILEVDECGCGRCPEHENKKRWAEIYAKFWEKSCPNGTTPEILQWFAQEAVAKGLV